MFVDVNVRPLRARARQPCFLVRMKSASVPENTVMDKSNRGLGLLLSKIVDCARMCFSSVRKRRSARTVFRPRKIATLQQRVGAI